MKNLIERVNSKENRKNFNLIENLEVSTTQNKYSKNGMEIISSKELNCKIRIKKLNDTLLIEHQLHTDKRKWNGYFYKMSDTSIQDDFINYYTEESKNNNCSYVSLDKFNNNKK